MRADARGAVPVVIPTFECAAYLPEAVRSRLEQTERDFEVIVLHDGSAANTPAAFYCHTGKVHAIRQPNLGEAGAAALLCHRSCDLSPQSVGRRRVAKRRVLAGMRGVR